jgi:WD40 repeat protein
VSAVAVRADDSSIFTGSRDYSVREIDLETKATKQRYSVPRNIVTFLERSSASDNLLFQGAEDLCVRVWDSRLSNNTSNPAMKLSNYTYFPLCGTLNCDANLLVTGCKGFNGVGCEVKVIIVVFC